MPMLDFFYIYNFKKKKLSRFETAVVEEVINRVVRFICYHSAEKFVPVVASRDCLGCSMCAREFALINDGDHTPDILIESGHPENRLCAKEVEVEWILLWAATQSVLNTIKIVQKKSLAGSAANDQITHFVEVCERKTVFR